MDNKKNKLIIPVLVICFIVFSGCLVVNAVLSRRPEGTHLGGLLGQLEVVASLLMVLFAGKAGFIIGVACNSVNAGIILVSQVIIAGRTNALPGVAVSVISIVILAVLYHYVSKTQRINAELTESYEKAVEQAEELKEKDESLRFLAYYDTLTSMPNRALFIDELDKKIISKKNTTILYIDLDNFRHINDTFGHSLGDDLLKIYAKKIQKLCGNDILAAKIGGDEFGLILGESFDSNDIVNTFAGNIAKELFEPINIRGDVFRITASYGVARFPTDTRSAEDLFRCAETAMFTAKANGKNQLCFYVRNR